MVVNDSLTDEIQVFHEHTNVFHEYMYASFYFKPMENDQLKAILSESMTQAYGGQCEFLEHLFDDYYGYLLQVFKPLTNNINEYIYSGIYIQALGQFGIRMPLSGLVSPNTTAEITYKVYFIPYAADQAGINSLGGRSTLTLMEIAG